MKHGIAGIRTEAARAQRRQTGDQFFNKPYNRLIGYLAIYFHRGPGMEATNRESFLMRYKSGEYHNFYKDNQFFTRSDAYRAAFDSIHSLIFHDSD